MAPAKLFMNVNVLAAAPSKCQLQLSKEHPTNEIPSSLDPLNTIMQFVKTTLVYELPSSSTRCAENSQLLKFIL